ncbi:hypothetical protein H0A36_23085 [Endozoicomonas sp. SM1973]|uniref:Solute-binding protein family 3/N-terminal domain-containing protein n=1 Tax=Spartinivicinus marinus TaxID=2994442 RepID=A0A853IEE8_9GAMM|nr:hypothetical protein [Spartinivicinus marinus]MCX4025335.1 hypothetical protein [Spartinivicinus marinus]NYZ68908.1 hypothetical protein [Spartinivicinus marinus]
MGDHYEGILIEELALFEKEHNIKAIPIVHKNWKRCQAEVENGRVDIILGANKTVEREKVFYYLSIPAFLNRSDVSAYTV